MTRRARKLVSILRVKSFRTVLLRHGAAATAETRIGTRVAQT
jgi:hypothetical protein